MQHLRTLIPVAILVFYGTIAAEQFDIYPAEIHLDASASDEQRLLVVLTDDAGFTHDVSDDSLIELTSADREIVALRGTRLLAKAAGEANLVVTYQGHRARVPVSVAGDSVARPVGFNRDVMPTLTRAGCNTGTCHGSARGQDKFLLSLFGYDPSGDYYRITREQTARRVNLAIPEDSLLLLKATGAVPHSGGKRFEVGSAYYHTVHRWIAEGTTNTDEANAEVEQIALYPREVVLEGTERSQPLLVMADYADGSRRDVTKYAVFISRDDNVTAVDQDGVLQPIGRGESFVTARFGKHTVGVNSIVLPANDAFQPNVAAGNYIDQLIANKLNQLHLPIAEQCTDEEFLRRAYIDLKGQLPTQADYESFIGQESPTKRSELTARLLEGNEFLDLWTQKMADLLLVRATNQLKDKAALRYFEWLRESLRAGVPYDELVQELLTVSGTSFNEPATGFYVAERNKLKIAENVAQVFLGIRLQCAKCHNHPFDRWTMDDYYGFAAFFAHVGHKQGEDYRDVTVFSGGGRTRHPVTGQNVLPKYLGGDSPDVKGKDRRQVAADWIINESPYFAVTAANRVWAHFFGLGIVEPVDDIRISNPPVNSPLYETLGNKFVEYDFDVRRLARDIVESNAYQRSTTLVGSSNDERRIVVQNFGAASQRRISATTLLDCICQVTEAPSEFNGVPKGSRAVHVADEGKNYFLTAFGRSDRTSVCACGSSTEPTLSQALHLLNGATVHNKIKQGKVVQKLLDKGRSATDVVQSLYVRCLSRKPSELELQALLEKVDEQQPGTLEDVFWAILNSREFVFNH